MLFHYADNRSQAVPLELLNEDCRALMCDGYQGYQKACDDYKITRLGCMAHARRKFKEAQAIGCSLAFSRLCSGLLMDFRISTGSQNM